MSHTSAQQVGASQRADLTDSDSHTACNKTTSSLQPGAKAGNSLQNLSSVTGLFPASLRESFQNPQPAGVEN